MRTLSTTTTLMETVGGLPPRRRRTCGSRRPLAASRFAEFVAVGRDRHLQAGAGKEPPVGPVDLPPVAEDRQQLRREHHVAVLLPLAVRDTRHHAFAVDGGYGEADGLGDAQAGGVPGGQDGAMLGGLTPRRETGPLLPG